MVETPPFPEKSLREAIRNAMMHNDYGSGIPIQIRIWEDRMRIADNGGIPYNWTEEDLLEDHESVPVNPSLANVFFLAGFVEGWGRGIQRIMDGYSDHPDKAPTFKVSHQSFTVILKNVNYGLWSDVPDDVPVVKSDLESPEVPGPSGGKIFTGDCDVPRCRIYERRHQEGQAIHRARIGRTHHTRCGQRYLGSDLDISP